MDRFDARKSARILASLAVALAVTGLAACTWGIYSPSDGGAPSTSNGGWFTAAQTTGTPRRITIVSGLASPGSTTLFWAQSAGQIEECTVTAPSTPGGPVSCSNPPETFATSNGPDHLTVINDVVYWADQPGTGDGNLNSCQAEGVSPCNADAGSTVLRTGGTEVTTRVFSSTTTDLYWVENQPTGASIFQCPLNCTAPPPSPIATSANNISTFTVLRTPAGPLPAGSLVWATTTQELWSCVPAPSGCPATMIGALGFTAFSFFTGDAAYPLLVTGNGSVNRIDCTTTPCNKAPLFQVPNDTTLFLNSDNNHFYVVTAGGTIYAADRNNDYSLTTLASGQNQIDGFASDGKYLYWTSSNGTVGGVPK